MEIKVIIADDEQFVCQAMQKSIPWEEIGMSCIGVADNGKSLLEMINKQNADIVITDIRMPEKSGLDVITETYVAGKDIEYIVLSGYKDFEYAHQAMRCGVKEYLLKPVSKEEIMTALQNCKKRVLEKMRINRLGCMLKENEKMIRKSLEEQYIMEVITGVTLIEDDKIHYLMDSDYRLVILKDISEGNDSANVIKMINLSELFFAKFKLVFSACINNAMIVLVELVETKEILNCIKQLSENYEKMYDRKIFAAVSDSFKFENIRNRYLMLKKISENSFLYENEKVILADDDVLVPEEAPIIEEYDNVAEYIRRYDMEKITVRVNELFDNMKCRNLSNDIMRNTCIEWVIRIHIKSRYDENSQVAETVNRIQKAVSMEEMKKIISEFFENLIEKDEMKEVTADNIIEKIKAIVEDEYGDSELTVRKIGENKLFLTPDYISRIFKQNTGINLNRYINMCRVGKAKELLREGKYKMHEIAEMSGFGGNAHYFSQVFKKITGMTPKEYEDEQKEKNT